MEGWTSAMLDLGWDWLSFGQNRKGTGRGLYPLPYLYMQGFGSLEGGGREVFWVERLVEMGM